MHLHHKINYLEIPVCDIAAAKLFFTEVFAWKFEDYGPDYCAFSNGVIDGGFFASQLHVSTQTGSALIVFYSAALQETQIKIERAGGTIVKPLFSFPGGYRFHFTDPVNNEYAVWSENAS